MILEVLDVEVLMEVVIGLLNLGVDVVSGMLYLLDPRQRPLMLLL